MWGYMDHYGWGSGMGIGMLLFWGLLIAAVVVMLRGSRDSGNHESGKSALDILQQRYARGEIGREEYEQKKRDLVE